MLAFLVNICIGLKMELQKLPKKARSYWLAKNMIVVIILLAAAVITSFLLSQNENFGMIWWVWGVFTVIAFFAILYPFLEYHFFGYSFDKERIVIKRGVIFRHYISVPVCQIQDLHLLEGPVMMIFGLKGLIISTAGSNFYLPCLDAEEAKSTVKNLEIFLKNRLEEKQNEEI